MGSADGSATIVMVVAGDAVVVRWRLDDAAPPDLGVVDALARLQLAVRPRGWSIRLAGPCRELSELLDLVGLADLLADRPDSAFESGRQAESREQLGIEEVVETRDPPA